MKSIFNKLIIYFLGIFYLFSGIAKIIDIDHFLYVVSSYNVKLLIYPALLIPVIEIVLAGMLLLNVRIKHSLIFSMALILGFTAIYSYGYFFRKIDDCGCFGEVEFLSTTPFLFFLRNGLLFFSTYFVYERIEKKNVTQGTIKIGLISVFAVVSFIFIINRVSLEQYLKPTPYTRNTIDSYHNSEFVGKHIQDTKLAPLVKTNPDSSYLVFIFSFDCPHCLLSTHNVRNYVKKDVCDEILGITEGTRKKERFFVENLKPQFDYRKIKAIEMRQITGFYPLSFYVEQDTVRFKVRGQLPEFDAFKEKYLKKQAPVLDQGILY